MAREGQETGDGSTGLAQKDEMKKGWGTGLIGARKLCFTLEEGFHDKARENRPAILPLNIDIIPWRRLVHIVLVFQAGYHFRVQYRMPVPDTVMNPVVRRG